MTPHNKGIEAILAKHPEAQTKRFREMLREAVRPSMVEEWGDEKENHVAFDEDAMRSIWMRPDAYLIVPKARLVICWEVEHNNRYKAGKYNELFWFLDEFFWKAKVVTVDAIYGAQRERDVMDEAYQGMLAAKEEALAGRA